MKVLHEYLRLQQEYEKKYGERTVILIEIGSFYEIYQYCPDFVNNENLKIDKDGKVWNESIGHAIEISVILNCVLTFENTNKPYSIFNFHKLGFPTISLEKNLHTLLSHDYVVVRVDQEKKPSKYGKEKVSRYVAEICSPTMQLENISLTRATSNIACIYIEYQQGKRGNTNNTNLDYRYFDNFLITTGVAVIDVITGQSRVCEFYSKVEDQVHPVQELYRFLISHYPRELIIHIDDMPKEFSTHTDETPSPYIKYLEKILELQRFDRLTTHVNQVPPEYKKVSYQIEFLNKIFNRECIKQPQSSGIQLNIAKIVSQQTKDLKKDTSQIRPLQTNNNNLSLPIVQNRNERIIEELGLERFNYGRIAYMILMQHCYAHNTDIISRLSKPDLEWLDAKKHLVLTHNAIIQLNIIPNIEKNTKLQKKTVIDSLMSVLDQNQTHLGRRCLYNILQNPMLNPDEIQIYYNMIDEMLNNRVESDPLWLYLDRQLRELPDIGRLQRKLEIKLITPKELSVLYRAYIKIINIYITIAGLPVPVLHSQMLAHNDVECFNSFISRFSSIFDFDAVECCHIDTSNESNTRWLEFVNNPIRPGFYPELDNYNQLLSNAESQLQGIVDHLNTFLTQKQGQKLAFKPAKRKQGATKQDPTGTIITTTASKATTLLNSPIDKNLCGVIQILPHNSSDRKITSDRIDNLCSEIDNSRMWMRKFLLNVYESILEEMSSKYTFYAPIANFIAKLDLIHSYSKVSHNYNYHRPELVTNDTDSSFIEARDIRHPVIERIIDGAYITNDIYLGPNTGDQNLRSNGMILFGLNAVGKSSLIQALALNIVQAQAGCYTSSKLRYKPYSKLITRLNKNDDMLKGKSAFEVEMTELRTILRQADANTLVIGDELCCTTETHSAMALTVATYRSLINKKSTFAFATHLHEALNLSYLQNLTKDQLNICHLEVVYDDINDILTYNRKLKDGPGASVYGLTVAKALQLPYDFIDLANEILLEVLQQNKELVSPKPSRYNKNVFMDSCAVCQKTNHQTELHTHHIIEQHLADNRHLIGNMHKNVKDNLIVLCNQCHNNLHRQGKELEIITSTTGKIVRIKSDCPDVTDTFINSEEINKIPLVTA